MVIAVAVALAALIIVHSGRSTLGLALLAGAPIIPLETFARLRGAALQGLGHVVLGQIPANLLRPLLLSLLLLVLVAARLQLIPAAATGLYSLATGAVLVVAHVWLKKRLPNAIPPTVVRKGGRWLASSIPMALTDGMRVAQSELSILLIGLITIPAAVGLFRIASVTALMAATPFTIVARVALPVMARLHAESDRSRLQKAVTAFSLAQFGGVLILSLPLLFAAEPLLRLAFGEQFVPAATPLRILALGQLANAAFGMNTGLLVMTHHERRVTRAMFIALALNVILVPLSVSLWGLAGASAAFVASLLCWNVLTWIDARRLLGIDTSIFARRDTPPTSGAGSLDQ
jgi:O-antigen/teichoic acid export membrane protein